MAFAMSVENVELVRAGFEAWNAGDMDAFAELLGPEVILRNPEGWPEEGPFVGREAVIRQCRDQRELWDSDGLEPTGFIDAADRVVVRFIWRAVGRGLESNLALTGVFTVRKRRVFAMEYFWDHAEALETLGLSGEAAGLQE